MRVTDLDAQIPDQIGHAFGYYDYGEEIGMDSFFRSKDAVADYIAGYVRMAFAGGMLYGIREPGRGYIAYKLPGQKLGFGASMELVKALFHSMSLKEIFRSCYLEGRNLFGGSDEKSEKALHLRRHGLCTGRISGAGLYEERDGTCLCRR